MKKLKSINQKSSIVLALAVIAGMSTLTGCATSEVLESNTKMTTKTVKNVLIEDHVVAFGKPATQLSNMSANSVVIVGEKKSYVLTQGGTEFVQLLSGLESKNIQVERELSFQSKNDGYFSGELRLSYAKLADELKRSDMQFFLQNGGKECTTDSDSRMQAKRYCFNINIKGGIYPQVSNLSLIQSQYQTLSKPYSISIYNTKTTTTKTTTDGANALEKLVMLPFAIAFDVIAIPFKVLGL